MVNHKINTFLFGLGKKDVLCTVPATIAVIYNPISDVVISFLDALYSQNDYCIQKRVSSRL